MDKYLLFVLILLMTGMGIGITKVPPNYILFYVSLAGAIGIIIYSSLKTRKKVQNERRSKRS